MVEKEFENLKRSCNRNVLIPKHEIVFYILASSHKMYFNLGMNFGNENILSFE